MKLAFEVTEIQKRIERLNASIANIEKSIALSEASIAELTHNISVREANIKEIDSFIQTRMVDMQSFVFLNSYIDFIVGAADFVDLVRRIEGINKITQADKSEIEQLTLEVNAFNADKLELERKVQSLEDNRRNLYQNKETAVGMQEAVEIILLEYRNLEAELMAKESYVAANLKDIQDQLKLISSSLKNVIASPGWMSPINGSFRVSAGVWSYPFGGTHLGADFAAPVGTELRAVANGVVIYSSNTCPTWGRFGNTCGSPGVNRGGNQVYLLVSVNGRTYGVIYMHLERDTAISSGQIINQGDYVGRVGSSGSSTGPHLHIEIHFLGTMSIADYASSWNGDLGFGNKWGNAGLSTRCDFNGNRAPCRENPLTIFGVSFGQSY